MYALRWIVLALACAAPAQQSWTLRLDDRGEGPRGAFPVGNGRVVGVLGTGGPAHEIRGLRRAHDHDARTTPGGLELRLTVRGRAAGWSAHRLARVPRTAVCVAEDREPGGLVLRARAFAPPGVDYLVQLVEVRNDAEHARTGVAVRIELTGNVRAALAGLEKGTLDLGDLPALSARRFAVTLAPSAAPPLLDLVQAEAAAASTALHWRERLGRALRVVSEPPGFGELVDACAIALLALRCETCGGVPANEHSGMLRQRHATGPLLAFLRLGLHDEARDLLRLHFAAAARLGRLPEILPPLSSVQSVPGTDWDTLEVPAGDLPSRIVLHHYWYWRATGDLEVVRTHWPLLEACLKNAPRGPGQPYSWSYSDSALFVQAVAAIGALREACGADGAAWSRRSVELLHETERRYWREDLGSFAPFAKSGSPIGEVNLLPVWSGQLAATGNRTRDNLRHTLAGLWRDGARVGSSTEEGHAPGELQGMLVAALTQFEGRGRRAALDALLEMAEPAGTWGLDYGPDGRVATPPEGLAVRLSTLATGVNLDAALFAVTGLRYAAAPGVDEDWLRLRVHLPRGVRRLRLDGMGCDGRRSDLALTDARSPDTGRRRLRFDLTLRSSHSRNRPLAVVQCMGVQFQRYLEVDETVTESADWREERESFLPGRR